MIKATGKIVVEPNFMYLSVDEDIARLYRSLLRKKGIILIRQRAGCHISVIRPEEVRQKPLSKGYHGEIVEFSYNPEYIQNNATHYWFRIVSPWLEDIRTSLDFSTQPVEVIGGELIDVHPFHLTIGRIAGTE